MTNKEILDAFNELKEEFTTRFSNIEGRLSDIEGRLSVVEAQNAAILEEIGKKKENQKELVVTEGSVAIAKQQGVKRLLNSDQRSLTSLDASQIGQEENHKKEVVTEGNVTFVKQGVKRRLLTPQQTSSLLAAFDASKYVDKERLQKLSLENDLGEDQIKKWFDNKRYRTNRQSKNFCDDDAAAVASTSGIKPITVKKEVFSGINVTNGEQSEDKENNGGGGLV
ncbi:unnamed protein product [Meloidogyne enterolobii]|uniref:Uncharacterized protein n=1 Tax=Meloidogyne enterolobii TaxID=390850 RepID=A0ACB0YWY7_MELEN